MAAPAQNGPKWRTNPFTRPSASPSPGPTPHGGRPKSVLIASPLSDQQQQPHTNMGHTRHQSFSPLSSAPVPSRSNSTRLRSNSNRYSTPGGTFTPSFIKAEDAQDSTEKVRGIEGENDFSGKRYVWLRDPQTAFVKGWVVEELDGGRLLVQCDNGNVRLSPNFNYKF
jgi:myosin protein heavy chain